MLHLQSKYGPEELIVTSTIRETTTEMLENPDDDRETESQVSEEQFLKISGFFL